MDVDGDFIVDYIYAGDLRGNMWKVDVSSTNSSTWDSAYKQGSTPKPLFVAIDGTSSSTVAQAITERPEVGPHPDGLNGYMVYFGTGRYIADGDKTPATSPINTFYGIWDKNSNSGSTPVVRDDLLTQTIAAPTTLTFDTDGDGTIDITTDVRSVTNTTMQWRTGNTGTCNPPSGGYTCLGWKANLRTNQSDALGEMSVSNPVLIGGTMPRIIFTTLIPESSACSFGGTSWLMELNPRNGGQFSQSVFDLNGDGVITNADLISGTTQVVGIKSTIGIMPEPVIVRDPANNQDIKITSGSTGAVGSTSNMTPNPGAGRQSWRQIK